MAAFTVPNLAVTMRAAFVNEFHQPYRIQDAYPRPEVVDSHDIVIRVAVASFCHTDGHGFGWTGFELAQRSHEPAGTIVSLGADAAVLGFKLGDRIASLGWRGLCGECVDCKDPVEKRYYCRFMKGFVGTTLPGHFQTSPLSALAMHHCVESSPIHKAQPGEWIGIVGSGGGLGRLAVQFAVKAGINVVAVDAREEGLELSKECGAQLVLDARKGDEQLTAAITEAIGDDKIKATVVLSDHGTACDIACTITQPHGTIIQVAQAQRVPFHFRAIIFKNLHFEGSLASGQEELEDVVTFVLKRSGKVSGKLVVVLDRDAAEADKAKDRW
ncbi:GroES-like protein [Trichoderma barbatum]